MSQLSDDSASLARLKYQVVRADFMSITADFVDSKMYAYVWAEMFRDIWHELRDLAAAIGADLDSDLEVQRLVDGLRTCLLPFITSEWAELVPFFLGRLLPAVQALPPGVSLTEPPAVNPSAPNVAPATAPVPLAPGLQTVTSSRPSPPAPANTRLASASSGPSQLVQPPAHPSPSSPRGSNAKRTSRCTRPSSPPVSPPVASGSGSAAVARPATTPSAQPQMPIDCHPGTRPDGWVTCNRCKKRKQRCAPPAGSARPFTSCTRCLLNKVECVRGPVEAVVHPPSRSPPQRRSSRLRAQTKPVTRPTPISGSDLYALPLDDPYPEVPPDVPLHGSPSAPLEDLFRWHDEVNASLRERSIAIAEHQRAVANMNTIIDALQAVVDAALSRLTDANRRRSTAWQAYVLLYGRAVSGRESSPASSTNARVSLFTEGNASDDEYEVSLELGADDAGAQMDLS